MARPGRKPKHMVTEVVMPDGTVETRPVTPEEWERGEGMSFLDSLPAKEATITIEKQNPVSQEWEWCCGPGPASSASVEQIRDVFGAGKYRCIARDANKKNVIGRRTFSIAGRAGASEPARDASNWITGGKAPPAEANASRMDRLMDTLLARALEPPPAAPSMLDQAAKLGVALAPLLPALQRLIPERRDPMVMAKELAEITRPAGASGDGAVDMFLRGMEVAQSLRAGAVPRPKDDRNSLGAVVRDFLPPILDVLGKAQRAAPETFAPPTATATPPAASTTPALPTGDGTTMTIYESLKPVVPALVQWAREGRDPYQVADGLMLQIPPYAMSVVEQETKLPHWRTRWFEVYPELAPYRPWIENVLTAVAEQFEPDPDEEVEDDVPSA